MAELCRIEASVPSGFEPTAQMEVQEKLGVDVTHERGKVMFEIAIEDVEKVIPLLSPTHGAVSQISVSVCVCFKCLF